MTRYLTVRQAAELLSIDSGKILAWIHSGELRASDVSQHRGGRPRWRVAEEDLQNFLSSRSQKPLPRVKRRRMPANVKNFF